MAFAARTSCALALATSVLFAGAANAELVVNGGFETGDFSGWTLFGDSGFTQVDSFAAHTGSFGASFGPFEPGGISQTLATVAGATYNISFFIRNLGDPPNSFEFNWDGGAPEWTNVDINAGFATLGFTLTASSNATDLRFTFTNPPSYWDLDDVSVNDAAAVPEPASLALLGLGLVGLAATRRRQG